MSIDFKIRRLLEMAARETTSEAEASIAMDKAQELLAKYNLTMAQVEEAADPRKPISDESQEKRTKENNQTHSAMYEWQRNLWATVASVNYCWHFVVKGRRRLVREDYQPMTKLHCIVGREANVISTRLMADYLEDTVNRLCPYRGKDTMSRSAMSWREGCVQRVCSRLYEKQEEMVAASVAEAASVTALTLRSVRDREYDANWMFLYGKKSHDEMVERRAKRARATIVDAGSETPLSNAERKKHEARLERAAKKSARANERYWERRDLSAWYDGRKAGDDISLAKQTGGSNVKEIDA